MAEFIVNNPALAAGKSLEELATVTGTSDSTVLRLATAAGFSGYRELRTAIALAAGAAAATAPAVLTGDIGPHDGITDTVAKLAESEKSAIDETRALLDPDALARVADLIIAARQVVVVGIAASGLVALDLAGKLSRIGILALAVTEGHAAMTTALVMRPEDVLVVISSSGTTTDIVDPFLQARGRGTSTIALTANTASPLGGADVMLVNVAARESALRSASMASRTGQMFVVDAVFTVIAQRTFDIAGAAIEQSYAVLAPRHTGTPSNTERNCGHPPPHG